MLILASSSPRRKEILSFFKIPFNVVLPDFDELSIPYEGNPHEYAGKISSGKAQAIQKLNLGLPILAADTIVVLGDELFLKPLDKNDAFKMLKKLVGKTHKVITAVTLLDEEKIKTITTETFVTFQGYDDLEIQRYIDSIPVLDKSGSYAIQGIGSLIVKKIEGCFYNVMGLPLNATYHLLLEFGFNLWDHIKE